jgi:two-component system, NarL family, response regulator DesR
VAVEDSERSRMEWFGSQRAAIAIAAIAQIAAALYLSEGTVRNYLSSCIQKTGARNRAEALRVAEEHGWL